MKGGAKVIIEAHRHEGVFIARSKEDALVTLNSTPGTTNSHLTLTNDSIASSIPSKHLACLPRALHSYVILSSALLH